MNFSREEILDQLERVVRSQAFHESESLRSFLSFIVNKVVDGEEDQINEYTIATDVFGRGKQFNPRIDSVVRVQAGRLRYKLHEYYSTEGKGDRILLELPKGHYKPVFSFLETNGSRQTEEKLEKANLEESVPPASAGVVRSHNPPAQPLRKERFLTLALSAAVVILAITSGVLFFSRQKALGELAGSDPGKPEEIYNEVWGDFFKSGEPPL